MIKTVISCSLYWVGAYGLTWAIKWIICTLFTDYNLIGNALNQMKFYESEGVSGATVVERVMRNLYPFKTTAFIMLFVVAVIILFVKHSLEIKNKTVIVEKTDWIDVIVGYILVMLIPLVMIVALGNGYAYTHAFMAHRQFSISVLGALCIEMVLIKALSRKCKNL